MRPRWASTWSSPTTTCPPSVLPTAVVGGGGPPPGGRRESPFKDLCGARGVAFKLCAAPRGLYARGAAGILQRPGRHRHHRRRHAPDRGEPHHRQGGRCSTCSTPGAPAWRPCWKKWGLAGKPVTADNVSFGIAPRLNAAGRMDSAAAALQLVLCEDPARAARSGPPAERDQRPAPGDRTEDRKGRWRKCWPPSPARTEDRVMLLWGQGLAPGRHRGSWHPA